MRSVCQVVVEFDSRHSAWSINYRMIILGCWYSNSGRQNHGKVCLVGLLSKLANFFRIHMTQIIIIQAANRNSTIAPSRRLLFKTWIGYSQLVSSFNFTLQINFCEMITIFWITVSDWSIESRRLQQHVTNITKKTNYTPMIEEVKGYAFRWQPTLRVISRSTRTTHWDTLASFWHSQNTTYANM